MRPVARAALTVGFAAAPVAAPLAQTLGQAPATGFPWLRWVLALAFCLLLAVGGAFALRARGDAPTLGLRGWSRRLAGRRVAFGRLTVVEAVRASPALEVCLLRCDGRDYLVAVTPQALLQLTPGPSGEPAASRP